MFIGRVDEKTIVNVNDCVHWSHPVSIVGCVCRGSCTLWSNLCVHVHPDVNDVAVIRAYFRMG